MNKEFAYLTREETKRLVVAIAPFCSPPATRERQWWCRWVGNAFQVMLRPEHVAKKLCWSSVLQIDVCSPALPWIPLPFFMTRRSDARREHRSSCSVWGTGTFEGECGNRTSEPREESPREGKRLKRLFSGGPRQLRLCRSLRKHQQFTQPLQTRDVSVTRLQLATQVQVPPYQVTRCVRRGMLSPHRWCSRCGYAPSNTIPGKDWNARSQRGVCVNPNAQDHAPSGQPVSAGAVTAAPAGGGSLHVCEDCLWCSAPDARRGPDAADSLAGLCTGLFPL